MTVTSIQALCHCDECGEPMTVDLDPAYKPPASWTLWDCAEDAVRGGNAGAGITSVQDDKMLCPICTKAEDAKYPDEDA